MILKRMSGLDLKSYSSLTEGSRVLAEDTFGPKVIELKNGLCLKMFRLKRLLSSALLIPYASRFAAAAENLSRLGIPTVAVEAVYRIEELKRHAVLYRPIAGATLREAIAASENPAGTIAGFASFLAELHGKGIYFRSIHFGNVIVTDGGGFGLIDIQEVRFPRLPMGLWKRIRNFKPIFHYREDRQAIFDYGVEKFAEQYLRAAKIPESAHAGFIQRLTRTQAPRLRPIPQPCRHL